MTEKTGNQNDWEATVQKVRDATARHICCSLVDREIYWGRKGGQMRYLGRIRPDRKVELVYGSAPLENLVSWCNLRTDLIEKDLDVIEYNDASHNPDRFIESIEKKAENLLALSQRLKSAQTVYIPVTAKVNKLKE